MTMTPMENLEALQVWEGVACSKGAGSTSSGAGSLSLEALREANCPLQIWLVNCSRAGVVVSLPIKTARSQTFNAHRGRCRMW